VFTAVAGGIAAGVTIEVRGDIVAHDVTVLRLAATKGLFASVVEERVTYVNAPQLAADRGVEVEVVTVDEAIDHQNLVTVCGALPDGRRVGVAGTVTVTATREIRKLTEVDGFDVDLPAEGVLLFFRYADRPGVVGSIGSLLGESDVNIAAMQVARREAGGEALMALTLDSWVDPELLSAITGTIGASRGSIVDLRGE
jgi:D-3-phosphoglycerate dehydrogenase / 2-oxoglutarate reductase